MKARVFVVLCALALACGSSSPEPSSPEAPAESEASEMSPEKAAAVKRLRARQAEVCDDFCGRMNACVREDAMANNPEVLETRDGVTGEEILAEHKRRCIDDCNNSGVMTPEQRKTLVEQCFPMAACGEFADCAARALGG